MDIKKVVTHEVQRFVDKGDVKVGYRFRIS
jgi:hypothetical protein